MPMDSKLGAPSAAAEAYLDLLKRCLTRTLFAADAYREVMPERGTLKYALWAPVRRKLARRGYVLAQLAQFDFERAIAGTEWPAYAETMVGLKRLDNIQERVADVLQHDVPGDLVETGVWRGGTAIFMRAVLKSLGDPDRCVWVADSFQGLPKPRPQDAQDAGDVHWRFGQLAIPLDEVKANFTRYELLDDRVRFLPGWFSETLPGAPIDQIAVLRVDADMHGSTMDVLSALYSRVSVGGYVIIDDYLALAQCASAVDEFRAANGIEDPLVEIDWSAVYWQRGSFGKVADAGGTLAPLEELSVPEEA